MWKLSISGRVSETGSLRKRMALKEALAIASSGFAIVTRSHACWVDWIWESRRKVTELGKEVRLKWDVEVELELEQKDVPPQAATAATAGCLGPKWLSSD